MDALLQQGITAYKAGKRDEARKIFISTVRQNSNNEVAWTWMFEVSNNDKERIYCLQELLRINPKNEKAKKRLETLTKQDISFESQEVIQAITQTTKNHTNIDSKKLQTSPQKTILTSMLIFALLLISILTSILYSFIFPKLIIYLPTPKPTAQPIIQPTIFIVPTENNFYREKADYAISKYIDTFQIISDRVPDMYTYTIEIETVIPALTELDNAAYLIDNLPSPPSDLEEIDILFQKLVPETYAMTSDFNTGYEMVTWVNGDYEINPNYDKDAYPNGMLHLKNISTYLSRISSSYP